MSTEATEEINTIPEDARRRISWYRSPLDKAELRALYVRSDLLGFLQGGGHLALLALTGSAAWVALGRVPFPVVLLILFAHGTFYAFLLNGFHELCHNTVFKTKALNTFFLRLFSLLGWHSYPLFQASHAKHHQYTLHPPDDGEVVLPIKLTRKGFWQGAIVNPGGVQWALKMHLRFAMGRLEGEWENMIFPESAPERRQRLFTWSRVTLAVHGSVLLVSIVMKWWLLPVLVTLAPFYGGWLQFLCNNTQHMGLTDNTADYRLCCRTVILHPFVRFLYWHMNYHTEHHMYAAVPCYRLGKLHKLIRWDLPHCRRGLIKAWREIAAILEEQEADSTYQFVPELPRSRKA